MIVPVNQFVGLMWSGWFQGTAACSASSSTSKSWRLESTSPLLGIDVHAAVSSIVRPGFFLGFYFWLDVVASASLFFEVCC